MRTYGRIPVGTLVFSAIVGLGLVGVTSAFLLSATPYGSFKDAKKSASQIYVAGDIDKTSIDSNLQKGVITFKIKDDDNEIETVRYTGRPLTNLAEATRVVAIGKFENGQFQSSEVRVKCPSKYQGEKTRGTKRAS